MAIFSKLVLLLLVTQRMEWKEHIRIVEVHCGLIDIGV